MFPQQAYTRTGDGAELWCDLNWSVSHVAWDRPGVYLARAEIILPDGYILEGPDRFYDAAVSIHPPGTSQVMEVFAFMRFGMKGHSWTFAMKAGQDMTPLVEALENITVYNGILDDPAANVSYTAEWDFSAVDPARPGIYPIYRSLTLAEESLPEGVSPEEVYLPDYWKDFPVLFSVEEPGGPQLYGVLESPFMFFGSYARLSEEALKELKVSYSIDGGDWIPQTDEGLMETYENDFLINKAAMAEGRSYSFRLELGDFVSRELTVQKDESSPVWFTSMMGGNRDGTIEVEFPDISQPPPTGPPGGEGDVPPTDAPGGGEDVPPTVPSDESHDNKPTRPDSGDGGWTGSGGSGDDGEPGSGSSGDGGETGSDSTDGGHPMDPSGGAQFPALPESGTGGAESSASPEQGIDSPSKDLPAGLYIARPAAASLPSPGEYGTSGWRDGVESRLAAGSQDSHHAKESEPGPKTAAEGTALSSEPDDRSVGQSSPAQDEIVTRWTTRISGTRCRKLIELYPDWILFQKGEVSVLLSSQWLEEQQMRDSDVLTVRVSPGEDHGVTILINEKEPRKPPVCRITVGDREKDRFAGAAATAALSLAIAGGAAVVFWRRRWRS